MRDKLMKKFNSTKQLKKIKLKQFVPIITSYKNVYCRAFIILSGTEAGLGN
jgi:hypothetical protein